MGSQLNKSQDSQPRDSILKTSSHNNRQIRYFPGLRKLSRSPVTLDVVNKYGDVTEEKHAREICLANLRCPLFPAGRKFKKHSCAELDCRYSIA